jgi:response regulator RpfG family c-di-GMP phosphodiesterase
VPRCWFPSWNGASASPGPRYLITFQARDGVVFDAAARQTLALMAHASARLRDVETGNHLERVHRITRLIAEAVADGFDAVTSTRPYRRRVSVAAFQDLLAAGVEG